VKGRDVGDPRIDARSSIAHSNAHAASQQSIAPGAFCP
jgi:hypothetical protein